MSYTLRSHQAEFDRLLGEVVRGRRVRRVIAAVTPGGGKSSLPVIAAARMLAAGRADRICWVVPRMSLQVQAEQAFLDPGLRAHLGFGGQIRAATNDVDPSRGLAGYTTTIQALGRDAGGRNRRAFERHRHVLVVDEGHHVWDGGEWHSALAPLVERAALVVLMSGSLVRHDGEPIAFLPYRDAADGRVVDLEGGDGTAAIRYSRADALAERAIIPLAFSHHDAQAEWVARDGSARQIASFDGAKGREASDALYAALSTEFAESLLEKAVADWGAARARNPRAKLLVVCASIEQAHRHLGRLLARGHRAGLATSQDSRSALGAIAAFKRHGPGALDLLVTVAMAYEGLDVPAATHLACLTHIRSYPWIEQMLARVTRFDRGAGPWGRQLARAFVPDDPRMRRIIEEIRGEQDAVLPPRDQGDGDEDGDGTPGERRPPTRVEPRSSAVSREWATDLVTGRSLTPAELLPAAPGPAPGPAPSEREAGLRAKIQQFCTRNDSRMRWAHGETNRRVYRKFRRPRDGMTLPQLEAVWAWLQSGAS
jgi:superfamily II DNA or RNA helicase